jgi:hypothetical protein
VKGIIKSYQWLFVVLLAVGSVFVVSGGGLILAAAEDPCSVSPKPEYCQAAEDTSRKDPVTDTIQKVTTLVAFIAGFLAVFWIILMGIKMQTSYGDPEKVKSARQGIIYAAVGLIVVIASQLLILSILKLIE